MSVRLYIKKDNNTVYIPIVADEITLTSERVGSPAKLEFTVVKDMIISFPEGVPVALWVDQTPVFQGFVFEKSRDKNQQIKCTAYDQLRYFKNKTTYINEGITASALLKNICKDQQVVLGEIEDTGYKVKVNEDNATIFDIVLGALDHTVANTKKLYVLYDDFGKICLKNIESMQLDYLLCDHVVEDFDYKSSIDEDTYNRICLYYEIKKDGEATKLVPVPVAEDKNTIATWGVLQYWEKIPDGTNGAERAKALLSLKNRVTRKLDIKNAIGDVRVRAGCSLNVLLSLGDINVQRKLICNTVTHHFKAHSHFMDITLWDKTGFIG